MYHKFHAVDTVDGVVCPITVAYVNEIANLSIDENPLFGTNLFDTTCFYFKCNLMSGEEIIFRVALKQKKFKAFLDIEIENSVTFETCILLYLIQEYYAYQIEKVKEIVEIDFGDSVTFMKFGEERHYVKIIDISWMETLNKARLFVPFTNT